MEDEDFSPQARILFVDDEAEILNAIKRIMRRSDYLVEMAISGEVALEKLENNHFDVIVSDKNMPGISGNELLAKVCQKWPDTIRIMLTAYSDIDDLIDAVNQGKIWGYLKKPWDNNSLLLTIEQALQTRNLLAECALLKRSLQAVNTIRKPSFMQFVGNSMAMQFVYRAIEQCAPSQANVFVTGPSGTGKELVADAIHKLSDKNNGPFICLNCAAIPSELMESEIFGHVKGAFSGAINHRDGAASLADKGTLFLDEIGEMDIALQAKILRFVQTGSFQKVGGNKTETVNVRFICATNRNPLVAIAENRLREDLYYRLNVISIDLPALASREQDALLIAKHFLKHYSEIENKVFVGFSRTAEQIINRYAWPGNVRQLQNIIHGAVIMSPGPMVTDSILIQLLKISPNEAQTLLNKSKLPINALPESQNTQTQSEVADLGSKQHIVPLAEVEKSAILNAIKLCDNNVVQAAKLLAVSPSTLYRKMQQWEK